MKTAKEWKELLEEEGKRAIHQHGVNAIDHFAEAFLAAVQADALAWAEGYCADAAQELMDTRDGNDEDVAVLAHIKTIQQAIREKKETP